MLLSMTMRARTLLVVVLSMAPLPLLSLAARAAADAVAHRAAIGLDRAAHLFASPRADEPREVFVEPEPDSIAPTEPPREVKSKTTRFVPAHGIRVRADAVLRLAKAGARPHGIPVPAQGNRPAGLALVGVSALGVGLQDGDVLVQAGGRPALSAGDVVGVVIGSRAQRVPEICGRFWRNGEAWNLVVEQPYVAPRAHHDEPVRVARNGN